MKKLPKKIDYSKEMSPVRNQGNEDTSIAFACCNMKEFQERRKK